MHKLNSTILLILITHICTYDMREKSENHISTKNKRTGNYICNYIVTRILEYTQLNDIKLPKGKKEKGINHSSVDKEVLDVYKQ